MKTEFCRVNTKDELWLDGLLFAPEGEARAAVLHFHGRAGNFYANGFLDAMARIYTDYNDSSATDDCLDIRMRRS
ncbi:MAG: hypothetical protein L7H18_05535 [Candidatus Nealsonbacteria bacterium DGGOD1a]|jgi:hypothetical protein|nr:MAG: hypothetical protein L7H18_05535 [Candidatus Nealsonbacteria bacterium DGGOD1a]